MARVHEHIMNARKDYLDKISTEIIKNHDVTSIEDLQVSNMLKIVNSPKYPGHNFEICWNTK